MLIFLLRMPACVQSPLSMQRPDLGQDELDLFPPLHRPTCLDLQLAAGYRSPALRITLLPS